MKTHVHLEGQGRQWVPHPDRRRRQEVSRGGDDNRASDIGVGIGIGHLEWREPALQTVSTVCTKAL